MARPLRLEFAGALYHVTARGNARQKIYLDAADRHGFLELLGKEIAQQRWICYAYCLMDNHYHLLIETPESNLVAGMRRLNGVYTQAFNRRHRRVGHLLQGRYKSIVVDKNAYLQELCRYIVLNPVRAKAVKRVDQWRWSSYAVTAGDALAQDWVAAQQVRALLGGRAAYRRFVAQGVDQASPWKQLRGQIFLGDEDFLGHMQRRLPSGQVTGIARSHMQPRRPTPEAVQRAVAAAYRLPAGKIMKRDHAEAYKAAVYLLRRAANESLAAVAKRAGISAARVSQIQTKIERDGLRGPLKALADYYKVKA
jgi:putative transposase